MDEDKTFDVIILGTGPVQCIVGALLARDKKKILVVDKNKYYGGELANVHLKGLLERHAKTKKLEEHIETIPKFIFQSGKLSELLLKMGIGNKVSYFSVNNCYVYINDRGVRSIPLSVADALLSPIFGFFDKIGVMRLLHYIASIKINDSNTWGGWDLNKLLMKNVYDYYGISKDSQDIIGFGMCFWHNEMYTEQPAIVSLQRINVHVESRLEYGKAPIVYSKGGFKDIISECSKLSAEYGGIYMMGKEFEKVIFDNDGQVAGIIMDNDAHYCKALLSDPYHLSDYCIKDGLLIRVFCILKDKIPFLEDELDQSISIIFPARQFTRKNNIYVTSLPVCHLGYDSDKYLAVVSGVAETNDPHSEFEKVIEIMGNILEKYTSVTDNYIWEGSKSNNCFVSNSIDGTNDAESFSYEGERLFNLIKKNL